MSHSATDCFRVPRVADGHLVRISGLAARPELNGTFGTTARYDAARGRHVVELEATGESVLLRANVLVEAMLPEAICDAAEAGDEAAVVAWLDGGGHVDARDQHDWTLLMCACGGSHGHERLVGRLLRADASVDHATHRGTTPLYMACQNGHTACA